MAGLDPDTNADTGPDRESTMGTPRWVKVSGIVALAVVVLVVIMLLLMGSEHGPARHSGGADGDTPSSSVMESVGVSSHTPPVGGHTP